MSDPKTLTIRPSRLRRVVVAFAAIGGLVASILVGGVGGAPPALAVTDETPSFVITQNDLEFILRQIQISEAHAADEMNPSNYELLCTSPAENAQNCVTHVARPAGVRTVDGSYNNLLHPEFGAADEGFPRLLVPEWRQAEPEELELGFDANTADQTAPCVSGTTCYLQTDGIVYDSEPRMISNLIVDQTESNPAIVNQLDAGTAFPVGGTGRVTIPNTAPDEELSAPFNTFTGFFGQFFDHGLDLVGKAGNGSMVIPLQPDDSLYCPETGEREVPGAEPVPCNPDANFITLSRATRIDNGTEHSNLTSPFIDQNQTYSSHPSHQVFLRQYELVGGVPQATGRLIEAPTGGMATWFDVKAQANDILGLQLTDADLLDVPQILVDPYGNFVPGANGYPQFVTGDGSGRVSGAPGGTPVPDDVLGTGHAFLDDLAHGSTPVVDDNGDLVPRFNPDGTPILDENNEPVLTGYDNAILDEHFIAGDGRVNENIGLTAVHAVFHAEHNRMVGQIEALLAADGNPDLDYLIAQDSDARGGLAEFAKAFRGEAHAYTSYKPEETLPQPQADDWTYQERLFQAAKFATEMQYQHLVFEEFGRKISPNIDAVVFNENSYDADVNAAITAEFAHVVYRFGHSMMTEEIGRESVEGGSEMSDVPLVTGFLNPVLYDQGGTLSSEEAAGSLINGMTSRVGSQIDEHVVDVLRNNLLGLPLDLASLNLLRGRDVGVPPLQDARATFFAATGDVSLRPYASWNDFGLNIKNGNNFGRGGDNASLVNFVAAYGDHSWLDEAVTLEEKREVAALLVNGAPLGEEFVSRLAGSDRYQTAQVIAQRHFTAPVPVVYIAAGSAFPDALAGGPLAASGGGPILLAGPVDSGEIPFATALALAQLQPQRIVVLGGPGAIGPNTVGALNSFSATDPPVQRIAGVDRFDTAAQIAALNSPGKRVFIANGLNFPDALAGSAVAASDGSSILLVTPTAIPEVTKAALATLDPSEIFILGEVGAVSAAVAAELATYTDGGVTRLGGADRYETALEISREFFPTGSDRLYIATGANFPDAVTASPGAGLNNAPVMLVPPTGLTPALRAEIARLSPDRIFILGGTGVVSTQVEMDLADFAPEPFEVPEDRAEFMSSTGAYVNVGGETVTGLEDVDFWMGGLAERLDPFGGMLGSSFNFVFETQLEKLQFGDRFYYLFRNQGEQLFAALEGNTFSDIIQRNTDASNLPADIFALQDPVLDLENLPADSGLLLEADGTYRWVGDEHLELHGTDGDDSIDSDEGDDSIWGYGGNDRIEGGSGNDSLVGGQGDDVLTDSFGDDNIKGKQGNDYIHLGAGIDLGLGGSGDDFIVNGGGDGSTIFAGLGNDIVLGTSGRMTVFGGEWDDWIQGSSHADLLQGDNANQFQNDTLGGNDVVIGGLGNDDIEGEGGDDILVGAAVGTDRHLGNIGFDWLTYYGQTAGVTSDWSFTRVVEPNNPLPSRFDQLEALSGGSGDDVLRGPLFAPDDIAPSEIPLHKATESTLALVGGMTDMLRPPGVGDFSLPIMRGTPEADADGVHKVMIGGPGSDTIEGRGGNDYLDGDAMLRVRLTDGVNFYDSASQVQAAVFNGTVNPGSIDIVRDIVFDDNPDAVDTAFYNNAFGSYTIDPVGPAGSGYWRITHVQVAEPEESDGTDIIRGFETLQFSDGCATLAEDGLSWEACLPSAFVTMSSAADPAFIEGQAVTASLFEDEAATVPFETGGVTNLLYTWSAGEGATPDTVTEWEVLVTSSSAEYVPDQAAVGSFLRVTVSYTDSDGFFRTATSAVSPTIVENVNQAGSLTLIAPDPVVTGVLLTVGGPLDGDGFNEDNPGFTYQWSYTTDDPDVVAEPVWVDVPAPEGEANAYTTTAADVGRWFRVTVSYTDLGGTAEVVTGRTLTSVVEP